MPTIVRTRHHHHGRRCPSPSPSSSPSAAASSTAPSRGTSSATMMKENICDAEEIITKWDPQASSYARVSSLFHDSRVEARRFLRAVGDLHAAMHFFIADSHHASSSALLVRAQNLMQAAMRRLQKEFHQILSANRDRLDPESVSTAKRSSQHSLDSSSSLSDLEDEEIRVATDSIGEVERVSAIAMTDLRSIAECLISSGYSKECIKIYKLIRRSIVDEGLYKLGFEKLSPTRVHKLDWDVLEIRIRNWVAASKVAVATLFSGERVLCDQVFSSSDSIRESCFADISMEPAVEFFRFPELVASKAKRSPEKMFRFLDMYNSLAESWPEIESVFSYQSTSTVRSQAVASFVKLGDAVRSMFSDFESAIQKDNSKVAVPGGRLHPLSRYVMNYMSLLADYSVSLDDIFADYPLQTPTPIPESFFEPPMSTSVPSSPSSLDGKNYHLSPLSVRLAWLILVLLCKLDSKAELYPEAALSYLFLANNLQYVVNKVRGSKLAELLGDDWVERHETKARGYATGYERLAWSHVVAAIPREPAKVAVMDAAAAEDRMLRFNEAFDGASRGQVGWTVTDGRMRDELKLSVAIKLVPAYRSFYERCRSLLRGGRESTAVVRFAPEDLMNCLSDLFYAGPGSSVSSVSGSSGSGSSRVPRQSM